MVNNEALTGEVTTVLQSWLNATQQFWQTVDKDGSLESQPEDRQKNTSKNPPRQTLLSIMKTWGAISNAMSEPSSLNAMVRGIALIPDMTTRITNTGINGYFKLQEQIIDKMGEMGQKTKPYSFENLDYDSFKALSELYEKEIKQILSIPQLGLSRFYQENMNQAVDKFNMLSTSFTEFMSLISLPMEKTFKVLQDQIENMTRQGNLPNDASELYRIWIKTLEGHYMTLFKSSEYTESMGMTLNSLEEFIAARNIVIQDALSSLPIPTNKDMDALYKELYQLKKKIKNLEKTRCYHGE